MASVASELPGVAATVRAACTAALLPISAKPFVSVTSSPPPRAIRVSALRAAFSSRTLRTTSCPVDPGSSA